MSGAGHSSPRHKATSSSRTSSPIARQRSVQPALHSPPDAPDDTAGDVDDIAIDIEQLAPPDARNVSTPKSAPTTAAAAANRRAGARTLSPAATAVSRQLSLLSVSPGTTATSSTSSSASASFRCSGQRPKSAYSARVLVFEDDDEDVDDDDEDVDDDENDEATTTTNDSNGNGSGATTMKSSTTTKHLRKSAGFLAAKSATALQRSASSASAATVATAAGSKAQRQQQQSSNNNALASTADEVADAAKVAAAGTPAGSAGEGSLLRMRNSALGKSAPSLSASMVSVWFVVERLNRRRDAWDNINREPKLI